jgi:hypothetical protein
LARGDHRGRSGFWKDDAWNRLAGVGARSTLVIGALGLVALAGCDAAPGPTEIVMVLQSDFEPPSEFDGLQMSFTLGELTPQPNAPQTFTISWAVPSSVDLPIAVSMEPGPMRSTFSMTVTLIHGLSSSSVPTILVRRSILAVQFAPRQQAMLVVPMMRACACQGTSCPGQGNPDCDDLHAPALQPLDPAVTPAGEKMPFTRIEIPPKF